MTGFTMPRMKGVFSSSDIQMLSLSRIDAEILTRSFRYVIKA